MKIRRKTLEGLRDAYIDLELEKTNPDFLLDRLCAWIDGLLEEADMLEEVRAALQADWEKHKRQQK